MMNGSLAVQLDGIGRMCSPIFKKLETDVDIADDWHGNDGPIKVRRVPEEHWTGHSKAMFETFKRAKYKYLPDQNGHFEDGFFPVTISNFDEKRVSAAIGYLTCLLYTSPSPRDV